MTVSGLSGSIKCPNYTFLIHFINNKMILMSHKREFGDKNNC